VVTSSAHEAFLAHATAATRARVSADPEFPAALRRALEQAHATWPDVALADEVFSGFLAERLEGTMLDALHVADAFLACACVRGVAAAQRAFDQVYLHRLALSLTRSRTRAETVEEVVQRLRVQLLVGERGEPGLVSFQARSDLHTWLRVVAVREAARVEKPAQREVASTDEAMLGELSATDPELGYLKALYRHEVLAALTAALATLPVRERRLLRHSLVDGLSIDELGALFQVHRATAARWLEKARELMSEALRSTLEERLKIDPAELEEVLSLVRSRLDVSVRRLLSSAADDAAPPTEP
jgi:RNA polymerase sigma-70 factor (ECF subfamily)